MFLNVSLSHTRSASLSLGRRPAATISISAAFSVGGNADKTPMAPSSVNIACPSSPWRFCAAAWSRSLRSRAATAALTSRPALPGGTPTSSLRPDKKPRGSPTTPVEVRCLHASSAYSIAALNMPVAALLGLTNSATDAFAEAHASRRSAMSAAVYSTPPTRLEESVASLDLATRILLSRCAGGQYPGDGRRHHSGSRASSAAAAAFFSCASSFARAFAAASERSGSTYARSSASAFPRAPRPTAYLSSTHTSRPPSERSVTQRPGPEPFGRLRRPPPLPNEGKRNPPEVDELPPPKPNTLVTAHAAANKTPQPSSPPSHGGGAAYPAPDRP
mmetsp:Transcript_15072/g.64557  ORF Transcript_15072/g.64557 Transcript_15072/m.64557 type:complete len:332 (-) Transcript_15072:295-1290(-)